MYCPPQPKGTPNAQPPHHHSHSLSGGILRATHIKSHTHPEPFSYGYILEDGKLPALTEFHPVHKKALPSHPQVQLSSDMQRSRSLKRKDKHPHFNPIAQEIQMAPQERTSDRLKRAFSLSGMKSSSHPRRTVSQPQPRREAPIPRRTQTTISPPSVDSRVPSLVLPTPSPSPEPAMSSSPPSSIKAPINYSLPRSSWASFGDEEDIRDLAFLRETAHGRLTPSPLPITEFRRDKAMAILGITDMPFTPPYTPLSSAAPSVRGYYSHVSSRRTSTENRRSQHIPKEDSVPQQNRRSQHMPKEDPVPQQQQPTPIPEQRETPKASQQGAKQSSSQESPLTTPTPRPHPLLRRKTSKFIEHLDANAEKLGLNPGTRLPLVVITQPRANTDPDLIVPISGKAMAPLRRSESMRTPSPNPGAWGAVVCTARAKPIVATGHARMVSS